MKKTLISLALVFSVMSSNYVFADSFKDVSEGSFKQAIDIVTSFEIMNGDKEGYFFPSNEVTRAEFAEIIYNVIKKKNDTPNADNTFNADDTNFWKDDSSDTSSDTSIETSYYFTDVPDYHSSYEAINFAASRGYMKGVGNGKFEPDRSIKLEEALKTILCSFSLALPQSIENSYPDRILSEAARLGLLDGIESQKGDFIKREELARIIYNSLDEQILNFEYVNAGEYNYYYNDNTVLSSIMNMDYVKDTVTMNDITSFTGESELNKNQIKIGETVINFADDKAEIRDMLGMKVKAYYKEDSYDEKQLVYYETVKQNDYLLVKSDDIDDFDNGILYYTQNDRRKSVKIPNGTPVVYNGKAISAYDRTNFLFQSGTVKIIKNSSSCDLVIIEDYSVMVAAEVDTKNRIIYNRLITDKFPSKWELEDEDEVLVYDAMGKVSSLEAILQGNVLNVISNNGYVKILISDSVISATAASFDSTEQSVMVGKNDYEISNDLLSFYGYTEPKSNDEVTLYLDCFGRVAWIDYKNEEISDCGYLIKTYINDDEDVFYKMYLPTGKFVELKAAKNVSYFDEKEKKTKLTDSERFTALRNTNMFIYYKLDDEGLLWQIAKPITKIGQKDKGRLIANIGKDETQNYYYKTNSATFGGVAFVDANTKVMVIPQDIYDYGKYSIKTFSIWSNNGRYAIEAYTSDPVSRYAQVVIYHSTESTTISTSRLAGFVQDIERTVDDDDNIIDRAIIRYGNDNIAVTSRVNEKGLSAFNGVKNPNGSGSFDIKKGDLIVYDANFDNEITSICSVYSPNAVYPGDPAQQGFLTGVQSDKYYISDSLVNVDTGVNNIAKMSNGNQELKNCNPYAAESGRGIDYGWRFTMWGFRFFVGYVYDFDGTYITYTTQNLRKDSEYLQNGIPNDAVSESGYVGVYITETQRYDQTENKYKIDYTGKTPVISQLNADEIKSFRKYGNACSKVLVKTRDGGSQQLFVIED